MVGRQSGSLPWTICDRGRNKLATREEVFWLYKTLLQREPESEEAVIATMAYDFLSARAALLSSKEFLLSNGSAETCSLYTRPAKARGTLALACIVKNEEERIERMIRSCLPLVNFIAVVDTGSTDNTYSIVENLLRNSMLTSYEIAQVPFENFAISRNKALGLVPSTSEWIIMLDGDEHLVPEDYSRFSSLLEYDVDAWYIPRFNFIDEEKRLPAQPYPDWQCRLFRNKAEMHFFGKVHERLLGPATTAHAPSNSSALNILGGPHIHHMGQVGLTSERWQEKHDFYTRLSRW